MFTTKTEDEIEAIYRDVCADLAADSTAKIARFFALDGHAPPLVVWNPAVDAIPEADLRRLRLYWEGLRDADALPRWRDFRPEEIGAGVLDLAIVDPLPEASDFRFVLYGSAVADKTFHDYRGETLREMALRTRTPAPILYRAVYALASARRQPVFTWNVAPRWQTVESWHRLVMPFVVDEGAALRFLVGLRPAGRRTPLTANV